MDWWGSLRRAGAWYETVVPGWAAGVIVWMLFNALGEHEHGGMTRHNLFSRCNTNEYNEALMHIVSKSLSKFTRWTLPRLLVATFVVSLLPLPKDSVLGNGGEVPSALHAPFVLLIAPGLVVVNWWILRILMWPIRKSKRILALTKSETGRGITRTALLSMFILLILISTFVPWQVASSSADQSTSRPTQLASPRPTRRRAHSSYEITFSTQNATSVPA